MKLNNKGFAITAVLYGLLILFVVLVGSYLLVLSAKKDRIDNIVSEIENSYYGAENNYIMNLKDYICDLYTNANKTVVTNNGINYNYAPSVNLMNDRLGDPTLDADSGNIRYYGADPNNYIYFNCSNYYNQSSSTCEIWRIIGIVDDKVKIIRDRTIGDYAFDGVYYSNDWSNSSLKDMLNENGTYYSELERKNSQTPELISNSTWYTNDMSYDGIYADQSYIGERTGNSTWIGKIALAYPSDYGYSADLKGCTNTLSTYADETCISVNWLTKLFTVDDSYWLITPFSSASDIVWFIDNGYIFAGGHDTSDLRGVLPVLYLDSTINIASNTDGSDTNPYRISLR